MSTGDSHSEGLSVTRELEARLGELRETQQYRELFERGRLSFAHNDYLALSSHREIIEAGEALMSTGPAGSGGSRLLGGNFALVDNAEREIADYFGAPSALFFSSGYLANLAVIQSMGAISEQIISDEANHASLIDGIRLTGKPKIVVPHGKWPQQVASFRGRTLVVTESLFSMDGDAVVGDELKRATAGSDTFLIVDEAHAAGVFDDEGRGILIPTLDWEHAAAVVTFGKAFGVQGAAVLSSRVVRDWMINTARTFIYSTAPPPVVVAMVRASLKVMKASGSRREELWRRAEWVRGRLGLISEKSSFWDRRSPIVPFVIGGNDRVMQFAKLMRESGIEVRAIRYPTVPKGTERLRISLNLGVSWDDTRFLVEELLRRWKEFSS